VIRDAGLLEIRAAQGVHRRRALAAAPAATEIEVEVIPRAVTAATAAPAGRVPAEVVAGAAQRAQARDEGDPTKHTW